MACNGLGYAVLMIWVVGCIVSLGAFFLFWKLLQDLCKLQGQVEFLKREVKRLEKSRE